MWPQWQDALLLIQPTTVHRSHRDRLIGVGGGVRDGQDDHGSIRRFAI